MAEPPEWLRAVMEAVTDSLVVVGHDDRIRAVNSRAGRLFGYAPDELIGRPLTLLVPDTLPERSAAPGQSDRRFAHPGLAGGSLTISGRRKDGSTFSAQGRLCPLDETGTTLLVITAPGAAASERELAEGEARFRALFEHSPQPIVVFAPDGDILAINDAVVRLIGYSHAEILANLGGLYMASEYVAEGLERFRRAAAGEPQSFTSVLLHRTGRAIPISVTNTPIVVDGRVIGVFAVVVDLTEKAHAQARLAAVVESSGDAIIGQDADGIVTSWNGAAERLYLYTAEEMVGSGAGRVIPPERAAEGAALRARVMSGERIDQFETVRMRKDGRRVAVSLTLAPMRDDVGTVIGLVGVARDVTVQHEAVEALRRSEAQFRTLIDQAVDAILVSDDRFRYTTVNRAACELFGYSEAEFLGLSMSDLIDAEEVGQQPLRLDDLSAGRLVLTQRMLRRKEGSRFPADLRTRRLSDGRYQCIVRDLTEQRRLEVQRDVFARSEKLRALGQMASGVAHNLNQQFALVSGYGDLASERVRAHYGHDGALSEMLRIMTQAALDGGETVKRLLAITRGATEGPARRVDVGQILHEVAQLTAPRWRDQAQAEGRPISLVAEADAPVAIHGWPHALREAFTNLVFNAVDALPWGGTIRLTARREDDQAVVVVADTGIGMTDEVQGHLFEPFFTTKGEHGTGLGLASVYGIVQRHHGTIAVESMPGRGTAFVLSFPLGATGEGAEAAFPAQDPTADALRVLAVDDEPALRMLLVAALQPEGHQVVAVGSAEEAVALLAARPFDVLLADVGLGAGMNGWQLAEHVRTLYPSVRIILVTGWGAEIGAAEARERGVDAVVSKPYLPRQLRDAIRAVMAGGP